MAAKTVPALRVRELIDYDPLTGVLRWRRRLGKTAGNLDPRGYVSICIDRCREKAHRLAWVYMTGAYPDGDIDHIDGDPSNNRWNNLRDVPHATNSQNQRKGHKGSVSGLLGVYRHSNGKWRAQICYGATRLSLGVFEKPEDAHQAYLAAKRDLHEGCTI